MKDWTSGVIDELGRCKRAGMDFDSAWAVAFAKHRPGRRDQGQPSADLFEAARQEESIPEFLRRVCADAWHGRRPELARLQLLAESDVFPSADVVPFGRLTPQHRNAA